MAKPKVYVTNGLGIGCHEEVAHAYAKAGADAEVVHIKQLLSGEKNIFDAQIINFAGGFLHGDILGAGMCAANELEHSVVNDERLKDRLVRFSEKGVIYGQCNGFQLLVKTGLLPGINNDYSKQTATLTHNDCGSYRVDYVRHNIEPLHASHFAFKNITYPISMWCRHGEGKLMFNSESGLVSTEEGERIRTVVNSRHVLLRYATPDNNRAESADYPHNPNGSVDGIAGIVNHNGHIFAHMAHSEVGIYASRDPDWFATKERLKRTAGMFPAPTFNHDSEFNNGECLRIFKNIVDYFK